MAGGKAGNSMKNQPSIDAAKALATKIAIEGNADVFILNAPMDGRLDSKAIKSVTSLRRGKMSC